MPESPQHHPVLGILQWDEVTASWNATVDLFFDQPVKLSITVEEHWIGAEPQLLFDTAAKYLERARQLEPSCRERVADDLLKKYNDSWADDDPDEGPPPRSRAEFIGELHLSAILLSYDLSASWIYEAGEMFSGHGISLILRNDGTFVGKATLWG